MNIASDLSFSVAVPGRTVATGSIRSAGASIVIETSDPVAALEGVLGSSRVPGGLTRLLGRRLHEAGLDVTVTGPRGDIGTIGAHVLNPIGRLLTGSWRVRPGRPAALAPLALWQARSLLRRQR